jgi:hydroxymethylbilane synthase
MSPLRLGTRGSKLALAQAHRLKADLTQLHSDLEVEIVTVRTSGDQGNRERLGAFVREIQEALLENRVDVALHCLKDLPTQEIPGLELSAYLEREDAADTIITRGTDWRDLPEGSTIGTGSVRRTSQLAFHRPDLKFKPLVGNVDTRLRKLQEGEYDAIVLAIAGLKRLGALETWQESEYRSLCVEPLGDDVMLPAPGQAILVLETRSGDGGSQDWIRGLHHPDTKRCAVAERSFLQAFGGGCSVPIAAKATIANGELNLSGLVAAPDGSKILRGQQSGAVEEAEAIGASLAEHLSANGARDLFQVVIREDA